MATPDLKQWADALVDRPINLSDDYGNLLLSTGIAFQQKPQDSQGLTSIPSDDVSHSPQHRHNEPLIVHADADRAPQSVEAPRTACGTCHKRKVKCDISQAGPPCSNCRKSQRDDCKLHKRRQRASNQKEGLVAKSSSSSHAKQDVAATANDDQSALAMSPLFVLYDAG